MAAWPWGALRSRLGSSLPATDHFGVGGGRGQGAGGARRNRRAPLTSNPLAHNGIVLSRVAFEERVVPDLAYQELAELWEAVFGDKPSIVADPGMTAEILVRCLPTAEPYSFKSEDEEGGG